MLKVASKTTLSTGSFHANLAIGSNFPVCSDLIVFFISALGFNILNALFRLIWLN